MTDGMEPESLRRELFSISASTQSRNNQRIASSLIIAAVIALLLWKTQWPAIQPGLIVLLAGQVALAGFLAFRNSQLKLYEGADVNAWFAREEAALRQATLLETGARVVGFALLAFGFWRSTGNLLLSLALGVVYPAVVYWGLARVTNRRATARLRAQQERLELLRANSSGR